MAPYRNLFFIWSYREAKAVALKGIGWIWLCTVLFGLAFGTCIGFLISMLQLGLY